MKAIIALFLAFIPTLSGFATPSRAEPADKPSRVLLRDVKALTLRNGRYTEHRRGPAKPQLSCVAGDAKDEYTVNIMRCVNEGPVSDDGNIQWRCTATLPTEYSLGFTNVICEGYERAGDPYVLKGSCSVEYELLYANDPNQHRSMIGGIFAMTMFGLVCIFLVAKSCCSGQREYDSNRYNSYTQGSTDDSTIYQNNDTTDSSSRTYHESTGYGTTHTT